MNRFQETIREIQIARQDFDAKITEYVTMEIQKFETETGLKVENIRFDMIRHQFLGNRMDSLVTAQAECNLELGHNVK